MDRRKNIKLLLAGSAGFICANGLASNDSTSGLSLGGLDYYFLKVTKSPTIFIPENKRIPFGWKTFWVGDNMHSAQFEINKINAAKLVNRDFLLRFSVALDSREEVVLAVEILNKNIKIAEIDVKYSPALQIHEVEILPVYLPKIIENGLVIFVANNTESKLCLFEEAKNNLGDDTIFQPHILAYKRKRVSKRYFFEQLFSENSLQRFGWMEGCVLDGLWQLEQFKTFTGVSSVIENHLARFFDSEGNLIHEDAQSRISDNIIPTIEAALPFAILAIQNPTHPFLKEVEKFWLEKKIKNGLVVDGNVVSAEGNYTLAYPMAVFGKIYNREDLIMMALAQLRLRAKRLIFNDDFYLRYYSNDERTFKNWARGVAWYLLGMVRTLTILREREDIDDLKQEFERAAKKALSFQRRDGLWNCFIDDDETIPDTSGSAGIAAAIAAACASGLLPHYLSTKVERTWEGLMQHLTPDGLLKHVAQSNKGGERLQRSEYRVISQIGMGLMGQLYAYL